MASIDLLGYQTLIDVMNDYSSMDAEGKYLVAAKVLHRRCPIVRMLPMERSNQIMSHIGTRESSLPTVGTRRFNEGITPTAGHSAPYSEQIALFEDYSEVDKSLWDIQNESERWRSGKDELKLEAMKQGVENAIIYGSQATNPGQFDGLATRFASSTNSPNGDSTWDYNVVLEGGSGSDTTSIWLVEFGVGKVMATYPKNLPGGLVINDLGETTKEEWDSTDSVMKLRQVLRTHFQWYFGLVIEDERCVQRIANVESTGSSNIFDADNLITMKNRLPGMGESPGTAIFCNRTTKTQMDIAAKDKSNGFYTSEDIFGMPVTKFQNVPIYVCEKIVDTETAIS